MADPKDKKAKPKKVTSEDQIGSGLAKRATQTVENVRIKREARLDEIMRQMRAAQTTDSHQ